MKVTFTQKDWDKLRTFQNSFNEKLGLQSYVGTDSACLFVEYSPRLKSMLRPYPQETVFDFEFKTVKCTDCPQWQPFLCALNEEPEYLCNPCYVKRQQKKKKAQEQSQRK